MAQPEWLDDWSDRIDEREYPDEWNEDDDFDDTIECTECGASVFEDAPSCPQCGAWIVQSTDAWKGRPVWWILIGMLGIVAVILALSIGP